MIPYIYINNHCSREVGGLLIQTLPPISKPMIRTEIEEIDGRDGDIVTTLGYSAYNKTFNIALKGDYDIDEVIKYFDTTGEIIFSNELDKVYKFAMYEQIDFERLIRYKTAEVTLHVQPFKLSATEEAINWTNTTQALSYQGSVRNSGNVYSKPVFNFVGSGEIKLYIDLELVLTITLETAQRCIVSAETMNATDGNGNYLNRQATGDYNNLILGVGTHDIRIVGTLTSVNIDNYSRWI